MLYIRMLGIPKIKIDDEEINIPYKKAEGVLYYLLVKKSATRDEIINLLWGEISEEKARKNLRNAIYRIKKALDLDIILAPKKNTLIINEEINMKVDYYDLYDDNFDYSKVSSEEFLRGFYIKDEEYFNSWIYSTNEEVLRDRSKKLKEVAASLKSGSIDKAIKLYEFIIELDRLDEEAYENLIKLYLESHQLKRASQVYNDLKNSLQEELGLMPDIKLEELIKKYRRSDHISANEENKDKARDILVGRKEEISKIELQIDSYLNEKNYKNILIYGDAGIGKSYLHDYILASIDQDFTCILRSLCYRVDRDFYLKPWSEIIRSLLEVSFVSESISYDFIKPIRLIFPGIFSNDQKREDLKVNNIRKAIDSNNVEEVLSSLLEIAIKKQKLIISFEDIHWMDKQSMSLLTRLIQRFRGKILFVFTYRLSHESEIRTFLSSVKEQSPVMEILLKEFSESETIEFIESNYRDELDQDMKLNIYRESEGVAFFIKEYINMLIDDGDIGGIPQRVAGVLENRYLNLSKNAKQIANISSVFTRGIDFDMLEIISGRDEFELIEIVDELKEKSIIKESSFDKGLLLFTHAKIKEFIYKKMSSSMKKLIHKKIFLSLEESLNSNKLLKSADIYSDLIYHSKKSEKFLEELKYKLTYLSLFLDYSHELYPVLKNPSKFENTKMFLDSENIDYEFKAIEMNIEEMKNIYHLDPLKEHLARFYYLRGRYLIREGDYERGSNDIELQIELLDESFHMDIIKAYKQLIYIAIQTHDTKKMKYYLDKSFEILSLEENLVEEGVLNRLLGLYKIMICAYDESKIILDKAIKTFYKDRLNIDKYILNIAACYNYIGEINRRIKKYDESIGNYRDAIRLCEENNVPSSLPIFYTNIGQTAFEMKSYKSAKDYLEKAIKLYEVSGTLWNRSIAELYLGLIYLYEKDYSLSNKYIMEADNTALKIQSPYDFGLINYAKFLIAGKLTGSDQAKNIYTNINICDRQKYLEEAKKYFENANAKFELDRLIEGNIL